MKNNFIILLLVLFGLTACTVSPHHLGFSSAEWDSMDRDKRAELVRNYQKLHAAKKSADIEDNKGDSHATIDVLIAEGTAMMPPFTEAYPYQPVSFRIQEGSCRQVLLEQLEGKHQVKMAVCFKKGILLLDPSPYDAEKGDSSARLYRSPLWRQGFNYQHINTTGYVRLHDVVIRVHD